MLWAIPDSRPASAAPGERSPTSVRASTRELPPLSPAILFNLITGVSGALQVFTEAYVLTNGSGSPDNGTLFYMMYLYNNAFRYASLGYASAMAVVLFLVGMLMAGLIYWLSRRFVNYDVSAG